MPRVYGVYVNVRSNDACIYAYTVTSLSRSNYALLNVVLLLEKLNNSSSLFHGHTPQAAIRDRVTCGRNQCPDSIPV